MRFEFWDKVMVIAYISMICVVVYLAFELNKSWKKECQGMCKKSPEYITSYLLFQKYRGDPITVLQESEITKKIQNETQTETILISFSVIDKMKHTKEFIVYNDMTLRCITDELLTHFDIRKTLEENEFNNLVNWCNNLNITELNCCPDGEAGRYHMISIRGGDPFNCCGSTLQNDAGIISGNIERFFNSVNISNE